MKVRTYTELSRLETFEDRFKYASVGGGVGEATFGGHRILNQDFYRSKEWKHARDLVMVRDNGCDLGCPDRPIFGKVIVHHLNPIVVMDFANDIDSLLDPEFMICVSHETHNLLHYGVEDYAPVTVIRRFQNDTCPWKI